MRGVKNTRPLTAAEEQIAQRVFGNTIPYREVLVSDGLGKDNRPFTVPTNVPMNIPFVPNFNVHGGKYVMHVGDGYSGMSNRKEDQCLLIHELTHVWQGENHAFWSWAYMIYSLKDQLLMDNAYQYDPAQLKPWSDYGAEQQATIVEDWFADGMRSFDPITETGDRRFYYIKKHIRGELVVGDWTGAMR